MKQKSSIFFFFLLLFGINYSVYSQNLISNFPIKTAVTQNNANPAYIAPFSGYFSIPFFGGINTQLNNDFVSYSRLISRGADDSLRFTPYNFIAGLSKENYIGEQLNVDIIRCGFSVKDNFFHFGMSIHQYSSLNLTKNTLSFLVLGPGASIGDNDLSGNSILFNSYFSLYAGWAKELNTQWQIGFRLKYIGGLYNFKTDYFDAKWSIFDQDINNPDRTPYTYNLAVDGQFKTNIPLDRNMEGFIFSPFENSGMGIDLGVNYTMSKDWSFNFSVLDIGAISWKGKNVSSWSSNSGNATFEFQGLQNANILGENKVPFDSLINKILANLIDTLGFHQNGRTAYRTWLPTQLIFGANYTVKEKHIFSAQMKFQFNVNAVNPDFTLSYTFIPSQNFAISVNNRINPSGFAHFGFATVFNPGFLQIHLAVENLNSIFVKNMQSVCVSAGVCLIFGKKDIHDSDARKRRAREGVLQNHAY